MEKLLKHEQKLISHVVFLILHRIKLNDNDIPTSYITDKDIDNILYIIDEDPESRKVQKAKKIQFINEMLLAFSDQNIKIIHKQQEEKKLILDFNKLDDNYLNHPEIIEHFKYGFKIGKCFIIGEFKKDILIPEFREFLDNEMIFLRTKKEYSKLNEKNFKREIISFLISNDHFIEYFENVKKNKLNEERFLTYSILNDIDTEQGIIFKNEKETIKLYKKWVYPPETYSDEKIIKKIKKGLENKSNFKMSKIPFQFEEARCFGFLISVNNMYRIIMERYYLSSSEIIQGRLQNIKNNQLGNLEIPESISIYFENIYFTLIE